MTNSSPMNYQRGNVVLCRTPMPSTQLQEFKVRPAVIISACTRLEKRYPNAQIWIVRVGSRYVRRFGTRHMVGFQQIE